MKERLINHVSLTRRLRQLLVLLALLLLPAGMWAEDYPITIAGVQVTSKNASDVLGDKKISYDVETNTLTLNGATVGEDGSNPEPTIPEAPGISYSGTDDLTISLIGSNTIYGMGGCDAIRYSGEPGDNQPKLIFAKGDNQPCSLQLSAIETTVISSGFSQINGVNGINDTYAEALTLIFNKEVSYGSESEGLYYYNEEVSYPVTSAVITSGYGLTVGDVMVHEGNAADILDGDETNDGKVSYNATTNTLKLDGADLSGNGISYEGAEDLTIALKGNSQVFSISYTNNEAEDIPQLLFTKAEGATDCTLALNSKGDGSVIDGFSDIDYGTFNTMSSDPLKYGKMTPEEDYICLLDAITNDFMSELTITTATTYPLWVGGTQVGGVAVSPLNYANITGANITGTVSFTPAIPASENIPAKPAKLTLNGATIDMTETNGYPIVSSLENLTVVLIGENTLKVNADKANGFHYSNAANSGTLTFAHTEFPGVNGFGKLTVTGGTIASGYTIGNDFPESQIVTGWRKSESTNSTLTYVEYYNLHVGDTQINSDELSILYGKVSYYPVTQTLSLNNFTTTDNIQTSLSNLVVALTGVNSVNKISFTGTDASGAITIRKNSSSTEEVNKLTATLENYDNDNITVDEPLHAIQPNVFSDVVYYALYINGARVNSENKNNITTGVSFDAATNTLTLDNVNTTLEKGAFIENGLDQLTINLLGANTVTCGNFNFLVKKDGDVDHDVAFTTDPRAAGNLTMTINKDVEWYTGHSTAYQNSLTAKTEESGDILTVTIAAPSEFYGLTIGGTEVTNMNAGNVQAGVSFDPTNNTLTLNTATITGNIEINRPELNVYLIGSNTMSGGFTLAEGCASSKLTFASPSGANDKLTMGAAFAAGITDEYSNHLQLDGTTIQLPNTYGITVAGIDITPTNRENVLNDGGKVVFDGNAKLILTDATINGKIKVESEAQLPDGLTIELVGHNRISNDNRVAIDNGLDRNLKVKFITVSNKSVSLVYYYTTAAPTLASAFENCDVSFADVLTSSENADAHTLTVGLKLELIVTETNPVADSNFREVMNSTTNTNNTVIDGWQYTMGDESAAPAEVGGFDQSTCKVTFTEKSVMDEIPQNSDDITGISTMIGAGEHILELKGVDIEPDYDMVVKVAEQAKPISVREEMEKKAKLVLPEVENRNISITLVTPKPGRIRICMIKRPTPSLAPAMKAGHRIGPKASVTGALGGLKVTNNNMQSPEPPATTYKSMEVSAVAAGIDAIGNALNGYTCGDPDITDLPDNMFVDNTPSSAPRRAGEVKTILPEGLTFVDFSGTKITGMEVDRTTGAFNGVPDNVFIYMPAGNSVAAGTRNVVIGGISDNVELDGGIDAKPFKAMKDFKAAQVTLKRTFEAGGADKKATIYLPYDIPQEDADLLGTFYEYTGKNETKVSMNQVTDGGLKANKPYIFQAKASVTDPMVRVVDVKASPADTEGFKGVYERKDYEPGMYCYAGENRGGVTIGQFVEMGPGSYVPPFRAYMIGNGAPSYAIAWDGIVDEFDDTTAIETIETKKTVASEKTSEGWWTLNGIRMTDKPKKAGLYIFNGKMVVVK